MGHEFDEYDNSVSEVFPLTSHGSSCNFWKMGLLGQWENVAFFLNHVICIDVYCELCENRK